MYSKIFGRTGGNVDGHTNKLICIVVWLDDPVPCCCSSDVRGRNEFGIGLHAVFAQVQTTQLFVFSHPQATPEGTVHQRIQDTTRVKTT